MQELNSLLPIMYNDMDNHLHKLKLCFQKCKKYGISLMCIHGIFNNDLGFYCFQRKEITRSKKNTSNNKRATI
jgi:hypothetical protein